MKTLILILVASVAVTVSFAQSEIQLHLSGGMKFLHKTNLAHPTGVIPAAVGTMGGGLTWIKGRLMTGAEFSYSDGVKESNDWRTVLTGVNFNILAGYRLLLNENNNLLIQSGFGYGLQHASVSDNNFTGASPLNTAMYHNFIFTLPLSAMFQHVNKNGTFVGIRASYGISIMPNEWRHMRDTATNRYSAGVDGLNLQVIIGGLLKTRS